MIKGKQISKRLTRHGKAVIGWGYGAPYICATCKLYGNRDVLVSTLKKGRENRFYPQILIFFKFYLNFF